MSSDFRLISFNGFTATRNADGLCGKCHDKITKGSDACQDHDMGTIFHRSCVENTKAYQEWLDLDNVEPLSDAEIWSIPTENFESSGSLAAQSANRQNAGFTRPLEAQQTGFWSRNRFKIIAGTAAVIAITGIAIAALNSKAEDWHRFCLQSAENAKELFCCAKQMSADAATCLFQRFEPANFWTYAGDPEFLTQDELPQTKPEPVILSSWPVTLAQKLVQRFLG